jgi:hypothetical protein
VPSTRPIVFFIASFVLLWLGLFIGSRIRRTRTQILDGGESKLISVVEGALLTLFGLLMGLLFQWRSAGTTLEKNSS